MTQLTGRELMALLSGLSDQQLEAPVVIEGCDCTGDAVGLEYVGGATTPHIYITRAPSPPTS